MSEILLLDDEGDLREEVADYLRGLGHAVSEAGSMRQFQQCFGSKPFDIVVIDRMLPDGDGLTLVNELRTQGVRCGIVIFSGMDASKERIRGFHSGADHYLTKPIRLEELGAVVSTLAWRVQTPTVWRLDRSQWVLHSPLQRSIKLTALEQGLLLALAQTPNKALSRHQIVEQLGKDQMHYDPRNLDALVLRLRKKVAEVTDEALPLKTVHGAGYSLSQAIDLA